MVTQCRLPRPTIRLAPRRLRNNDDMYRLAVKPLTDLAGTADDHIKMVGDALVHVPHTRAWEAAAQEVADNFVRYSALVRPLTQDASASIVSIHSNRRKK